MKITVLGSGSAGNSTFLESGGGSILIDVGFGPRSLKGRLKLAGCGSDGLAAVLLTHGHRDHVSGVLPLVKELGVPVYMGRGTRDEAFGLNEIEDWRPLEAGVGFEVAGFEVVPFLVPHDAEEPVGFQLTCNGVKGALVTDIGHITSEVISRIRGCDWLVLESNHDEDMVRVGPYPWELKRRVLSHVGHLSNRALAAFLRTGFDGRARHLFLAHLSRKNNHPQLARDTAWNALSEGAPLFRRLDHRIHLTDQSKPSIVIDL